MSVHHSLDPASRKRSNHLTACRNASSLANLCSGSDRSALTAKPCCVPEYSESWYGRAVSASSASSSALRAGGSSASLSAAATDTGPAAARTSPGSRKLGCAAKATSTPAAPAAAAAERNAYRPPKQYPGAPMRETPSSSRRYATALAMMGSVASGPCRARNSLVLKPGTLMSPGAGEPLKRSGATAR